jgi:nicotinamide riboside kinase
MRIAISGTHSIGKTTLARWISRTFDIPYIGEQARHLLETKYHFSEVERNLELFKNFQRDILHGQISTETAHNTFVADRPVLDSAVYVKERLIKERDADTDYWHSYYDKVLKWMRMNYDVVFFLRYDDNFFEDDGYRNVNKFYMSVIDEMLHYLYLIHFPSLVVEVNTPRWEERKAIVEETLEEM